MTISILGLTAALAWAQAATAPATAPASAPKPAAAPAPPPVPAKPAAKTAVVVEPPPAIDPILAGSRGSGSLDVGWTLVEGSAGYTVAPDETLAMPVLTNSGKRATIEARTAPAEGYTLRAKLHGGGATFSVGCKDARDPGMFMAVTFATTGASVSARVSESYLKPVDLPAPAPAPGATPAAAAPAAAAPARPAPLPIWMTRPLHPPARADAEGDAAGYVASRSVAFNYRLRAYEQVPPAWPESLRRRVEYDMGKLPLGDQKWVDVRVEIAPGAVCFWMDDRLVSVKRDAAISPAGIARIDVQKGASIAAVSLTPRKPTPGFQPIELNGYANARALLGSASVAPASLPPIDAPTVIEGVPFVLSRTNVEGLDHIDVGRSETRQGTLEGYLPSNSPRYSGADMRDPARIQLRVPNGVYESLYVLAACDDEGDSLPTFTAMFYRPEAGFAVPFEARVPLASAKASETLPGISVTLTDGRKARLCLVRVPLDPGQLSSFADLDIVEIELTKKVALYRSYPDPISYAWHGAGLPSAVHIYAATLADAPITFDWSPDSFGHVWQSPDVASYTATLVNRTGKPQTGTLTVATRSYDRGESTSVKKEVSLPADGTLVKVPVKFESLKKFGYHDIDATLDIAGRQWAEHRSFVRLAPDTRSPRWTDGKGAMFGFWSYMGGHYTPRPEHIVRLMTWAGGRQDMHPPKVSTPEANAMLDAHWGASQSSPWHIGGMASWSGEDSPDPKAVEDFQAKAMAAIHKEFDGVAEPRRPDSVNFFAEPSLSARLSAGNIPEYWQEKPYELTDDERLRLKRHFNTAKAAAEAVRREFPGIKILLPWGDPGFVWPILRAGFPKELIDGTAIDVPGFERIPERQLHEQSIHRLYAMRKEFEKAGIPNPRLQFCEGIFVPTEPGSVTWREQMDIYNRWALISIAYGVNRFHSGWFAFDCGNYYGSEHYGGCGIQRRIPYCDPKPAYAAYATMTDRLNEANFDGWEKTGSLSTYALRFKHEKRGNIYTLWTLRGSRPVTITFDADATINVTDAMNNTREVKTANKAATITLDQSVTYITFPDGKGRIVSVEAGETDHADANPGEGTSGKPIADLGDGTWKFTNERDEIYEHNHFAVMKYAGKFSAAVEKDGKQGDVLVSTLEKQETEHQLMPWYNVLRPAKPIALAGAPARLGIWARGASDWGRVIYILRDAKGERWVSIGTKDQYNCDDAHDWSSFCYDGWRFLRFELPGSAGWDNFRKAGTIWWRGDGGPGDASAGVVDLPLSLEGIILEQRTHALYVNDIQPVSSNKIALGKLFVEYDDPADASDEAVRLSKLRQPLPAGLPDLPNPIAEMKEDGIAEPTKIVKLVPPDTQNDGTKVTVHFDEAAGAGKYYVWVGTYPDGRGAVNMTPRGAKPGALVGGLRPAVKFYFWVTYELAPDGSGAPIAAAKPKPAAAKTGPKLSAMSKPSAPMEAVLIDMFKEK
ncbi:MAG: hypothetical protein NTW19_04205 [Planctomycetota bacterium]|nr:hypothetical protein [Planctomycetota bacterium]